MNIIIPLGGKGERFLKNGYMQPKPLIPILDKCMIEYVLDNLTISNNNDKIFIIYNVSLDSYDFYQYIGNKYPSIQFIKINDTKGAVESLFLGITYILNNYSYNSKCLILDCDTFYTQDIVSIFKNSNENMVFYTKNYEIDPIYSYIELNDSNIITNIREKNKISDNANTGAYAFTDIKVLHSYCKYVLDNNITFNNEPYTSCVISEMIKTNIFKGYELNEDNVFSLGTPSAVKKYIDNTYAFLFDLDGTLVITDEIYYEVWHKILSDYNIILTPEIFKKFIQGNNDKYVLNSLLANINIQVDELSKIKDELFIQNIHKVKIVDGIYNIINDIKLLGHKLCIVTNCNKSVANEIVKCININNSIDFIISNNDCVNGKPSIEPYKKALDKYNISNNKCFIFEDSKTGIISGKGVSPKLLIGVETIYDKTELTNFGVKMTVNNFSNLNINKLINYQENSIVYLTNIIKDCSFIYDIKDIIIDDDKLKGGFIADVVSIKVIDKTGKIYSQILKYENKENNGLSIMARKLKLYEREYYFYTNISSQINVKVPKFYGLVKDNFEDVGIILENLIDKKYKVNLNLNLESTDVTLKIVNRMAKLHSKFWNKDLKKMFPKLKKTNDNLVLIVLFYHQYNLEFQGY
jgi:HAD superfamily hydrolase (TIGR01509 family)